jgi:excisionase family DNA binding protein
MGLRLCYHMTCSKCRPVHLIARLCSALQVEVKNMNDTELKLLFSKTEGAAALSISRRKIDYLIAEKKLRATRIGRRTLIHRREIERIAREGAA